MLYQHTLQIFKIYIKQEPPRDRLELHFNQLYSFMVNFYTPHLTLNFICQLIYKVMSNIFAFLLRNESVVIFSEWWVFFFCFLLKDHLLSNFTDAVASIKKQTDKTYVNNLIVTNIYRVFFSNLDRIPQAFCVPR